MKKVFFYTIFLVCLLQNNFAQLTANAGVSKTVCISSTFTLGGLPSASGGNPPYTYQWQPADFLNSTIVANPVASSFSYYVQYTLTVTDKDTNTAVSLVYFDLNKIYTFSAGIDTGYCFMQSLGIKIGASNNNNNALHNFSWSPVIGLDNPDSTNPIATPTVTTIYTLTVSDGKCPDNISQVTVTPFLPPFINAGNDTTIYEGQEIALAGIGAILFYWGPDYNIKYRATPNPDVYPITTSTYVLWTQDHHGCTNSDDITVTVIPNDQLIFYKVFTPNSDGENDVFYIANLQKYPDNSLKIYNRYGKVIYSVSNYDNSWNGVYLGEVVPTGTYFYILNDGNGNLHKGSVTILR